MSSRKQTPPSAAPAAYKCRCDESRRGFLRDAALTAGGRGLLGLSASSARADIPTNCTPVPAPPANPIPFTPDPNLPMRTRKSAFRLTTDEVNRLRRAYRALRRLTVTDPNDPRGWMRQANVHCHYCGGASGTGSPEVHGSWRFFPWHRAFLYFHERILAKLINDDTFALPYWDWNTSAVRSTIPPIYGPQRFIPRLSIINSLLDFNRGVKPTDKIPAEYCAPAHISDLLDAPNFSTFGGTSNGGGNIEFGPHGVIHVWTGDVNIDFNNPKPDMGVLQTASQDPLFFAHHGNIDRLWDVWNSSSAAHTNPTSNSWLNLSWNFYDENKQWRSIKASDVVDLENSLRYRYASPRGLVLTQIPRLEALRALAPQEVRTRVHVTAPDQQERIRLDPEPRTQRVQLPADLHLRMRSARLPTGSDAPATVPVYSLHIEGIEVPPHKSALVRVYANLPTANAATGTNTPNYLGYFTVVAKSTTAGEHRHDPLNVKLDITKRVSRLLGASRDLSITLVPVTGARTKPRQVNLSYRRIFITEEQ